VEGEEGKTTVKKKRSVKRTASGKRKPQADREKIGRQNKGRMKNYKMNKQRGGRGGNPEEISNSSTKQKEDCPTPHQRKKNVRQ